MVSNLPSSAGTSTASLSPRKYEPVIATTCTLSRAMKAPSWLPSLLSGLAET